MARITESELLEIIDVDDSVTTTSPFITAANLLVTDKLAGSGLSDALLKEIERWLAAHFIAIRDPRAASEAAQGVSVSYQGGGYGAGLMGTQYGQQAVTLDYTGTLAALGKKKVVFAVADYAVS